MALVTLISKIIFILFFFLFLYFFESLLVYGEESLVVYGEAKVIDGDTIHIGKNKIRLHGIDAPERDQKCIFNNKDWECGKNSTLFLIKIIGNYPVKCRTNGVDRYKRYIAVCFSGKKTLEEKKKKNNFHRNLFIHPSLPIPLFPLFLSLSHHLYRYFTYTFPLRLAHTRMSLKPPIPASSPSQTLHRSVSTPSR